MKTDIQEIEDMGELLARKVAVEPCKGPAIHRKDRCQLYSNRLTGSGCHVLEIIKSQCNSCRIVSGSFPIIFVFCYSILTRFQGLVLITLVNQPKLTISTQTRR